MATIHTKKGDINLTNSIFDNDYKNYIRKLQNDIIVELLPETGTADIISFFEAFQLELRNHFKRHNTKIKKIVNQDYFAMGISCISDMNVCNSFIDVFNEKNYCITENILQYDENKYEKTKCICGQSVFCKNTYIIKNIKTNKSLLVGNDCIDKNKIINIDMFKFIKDEREKRQNPEKYFEKQRKKELKKYNKQLKEEREMKKQQKKQEEEARLLNIIEQNKRYSLWKEEDNRCNKENDEMGKEDVYSQHIRKTELDKIKKKDLLIKWKGLVRKSVKHNNKIFWKNVSNLISFKSSN